MNIFDIIMDSGIILYDSSYEVIQNQIENFRNQWGKHS